MKLLIKHLPEDACNNCRNKHLKDIMDQAGVGYSCSDLKEVEIQGDFSESRQAEINGLLRMVGIELVSDRTQTLTEGIKSLLNLLVEPSEKLRGISIRQFLASKLYYSYSHLSKVFHNSAGISPEHYLISKKIERVKEMLTLEHLTLTEIAFRLNYSSVAHLSHQFHEVTGMNATQWKRSQSNKNAVVSTLREVATLLLVPVTGWLLQSRSFALEDAGSLLQL